LRVQNWPSILFAKIEDAKKTPFQWGVFDCALFTADCVFAITGNDPARNYRNRYKTQRGAMGIIKREGFDSLAEMMDTWYDTPVTKHFLRRGDVGMFDGGNGPTVGICTGAHVVAPSENGLVSVPVSLCFKGWSI